MKTPAPNLFRRACVNLCKVPPRNHRIAPSQERVAAILMSEATALDSRSELSGIIVPTLYDTDGVSKIPGILYPGDSSADRK